MVVGAFVIIAFCSLIYLLFLFGELPVAISQMRSYEVLVNFKDAPGIQQNTPVQLAGYQVGRVINVSAPFRFEDDQGRTYHEVKVTLAIDRKYQTIDRDVNVLLMKRGLGSSYIVLEEEPDKEISSFLSDGDVLEGELGTSTEFIPKKVQEKLEKLVDSVSELSGHANDIVGDEENKANIKRTLGNIAQASAEAKDTLRSIRGFADTGSEKLEVLTEEINGTLSEIRVILAKVNDGEGTVGRIVNDGRLYENLLQSSIELELLLEELKMFAAETRDGGLKIKW